MKFDVKKLYLYSATLIGLVITIIGSYQIIDLGLKTFVFPEADRYSYAPPLMDPRSGESYSEEELSKLKAEQEERAEIERARARNRQLSTALALLATGVPVYVYHFRLVNKEG